MAKLTKNERIMKLLNIQKVLCGCIDRATRDDIYAAVFETTCNLRWITKEIDALYLHEREYDEEMQCESNSMKVEEIKAGLESLRNDAWCYDKEITDILKLVNELEV